MTYRYQTLDLIPEYTPNKLILILESNRFIYLLILVHFKKNIFTLCTAAYARNLPNKRQQVASSITEITSQ